jgi:hypothetical protein
MKACRLDALSGRNSGCPRDACPFWEPGGAVIDPSCAFERLDLAGRPGIVAELLRMRAQLMATASAAEERCARLSLHRLLSDSREE